MAWSANEVYLPGFVAENDLSAKRHFFAELSSTAGQVDVCDGASDQVIGVICNEPKEDKEVLLQVAGVAKVSAGGTIAIGDRIGTDASGEAVAKTADADLVCGIALEAGVDGDIVSILLTLGAQRAS